ncbi:MAG: hypothetical protein KJ774_04595 [Firmicutes bacterium]|nr:hypothetical protein [Bacillota bacterium]
MKKTTVSILSAITVMSMAFSPNVFAASNQTTTDTAAVVSDTMGVQYRGHIQNTGDY